MKNLCALQSLQLRASPPTRTPSEYPDLSGLRYLGTRYFAATGGRIPYTQTNPYTQTSSSRRARTGTASCAQPCRPAYPYQQVPIDANGVLTQCNSGLAGAAVALLHSLPFNR